MVCLGNICRSPMAEGILREKMRNAGIEGDVDSCGTSSWHVGESPDGRAEATLRSKGMDISELKARQFHHSDFDTFDLIYAMDETNLKDILAQATLSDYNSKVKMILESTHPGENKSVPDPYYGDGDGFEIVYSLLNDACDEIVNCWPESHNNNIGS